jgi:hypothetical protein
MEAVTKQKSRRVRRALLALSDAQLIWIIQDWLKSALQAWPMNETDDAALFVLGYQLKVTETGKIYPSWDDFHEDEEFEFEGVELVPPTDIDWRVKITTLALPTFYHTILWAAGEALDNSGFADIWGQPPGPKRSGYAFLDKLADHLVLAYKLSGDNLDRFVYATRRLGILSYRDEESSDDSSEIAAHDGPSPYPDLDAEIERLVHEPELPYWLRTRRQRGKHKRR